MYNPRMKQEFTTQPMKISDEKVIHRIYWQYFQYGVVPSRKNMLGPAQRLAFVALAMWCSTSGIILDHFLEALDEYE